MRIKKQTVILISLGLLITLSINNSLLTGSNGSNTEESYFTIDWETTVGGDSFEIVKAVIKTNDGEYIAAGSTESYGAGDSDGYVVKVDANGNLLWNKSFGGGAYDEMWGITDTADGNFILTGETRSFGAGGLDVWFLKMDTDGNLLWNKTFGLADAEWPRAIARSGEDIYVTGFFHPIVNANGEFLLLKMDQDGNFLWNKSFGFGRGFEIITVGTNGTLITGFSDDDYLLLRVDDQGNELWRKTYGGPLFDLCERAITTPDGGFIVAGNSRSFGAGSEDSWIIKVDKDGNHEWNKTFGGISGDFPNAILNHKDGGYLLVIHTLTYGPGNGDNWIIKLDESGNKEWEQFTGYQEGDDFAYEMIEVSDNTYVLAGRTEVGGTNSDVWMFQITLNESIPSSASPGFGYFVLFPIIIALGTIRNRRLK